MQQCKQAAKFKRKNETKKMFLFSFCFMQRTQQKWPYRVNILQEL